MSDEMNNANAPELSFEELKTELEVARQKSQEYLEGWKRAKADYLNFKKDADKRQEEVIQFANAALIAEILPIIDHFKLALRHMPDTISQTDWAKGVVAIKKQFDEFLKQLGIEEIKTVGEKFDHLLHEAVTHEAKEGFASDVIFDEVKPGYTLHGKVISVAKVKVAK